MNNNKRPIGVFDSGVGGLTVVKEIISRMPNEDIIYFGDTARVPYGTKSARAIKRFSVENSLFLLSFDVKCIVAACNTSSSVALDILKQNFRAPVIGVIEPGARQALSVTKNGRIGIIGTRATVASNAYENQIRRLAEAEFLKRPDSLKIISQSCPLFVSLAEEGWVDDPITRQVARRYLSGFKQSRIDTLILGCTHYPLLKGVIGAVLGRDVRLVDSASQCAAEAERILDAEGILNDKKTKGALRFFVSDEPQRFAALGKSFLGSRITCIQRSGDV